MEKTRHNFENIKVQTALHPEAVPDHPIVEIAGEHRVLIENHKGIAAYGKEKVLVNVRFGSICIAGCNLQIIRMTKGQLIIYGSIHSVGLHRRN